ncbi:hypothetical protein M0804_010508 [Polistes exclamans]|nr:hypothetical protein M0804_010508 [Polistes exclamans]
MAFQRASQREVFRGKEEEEEEDEEEDEEEEEEENEEEPAAMTVFAGMSCRKGEMDDQQLENTKKYERKETRREMMARKRLQLRQLFAMELIEQEKLLRELGYSFINTHH